MALMNSCLHELDGKWMLTHKSAEQHSARKLLALLAGPATSMLDTSGAPGGDGQHEADCAHLHRHAKTAAHRASGKMCVDKEAHSPRPQRNSRQCLMRALLRSRGRTMLRWLARVPRWAWDGRSHSQAVL